jgi:hypothetical protein
MPTADEELRREWRHYDEDGGDRMAMRFLEDAGYRLRRDWQWTPPKPDHLPTDREVSAVYYLVDEWDFGGIYFSGEEP